MPRAIKNLLFVGFAVHIDAVEREDFEIKLARSHGERSEGLLQ